MKELKFLYCEKCKKLELQVIGTKAPTICCGQPMKVLEANTTDAAGEKHVPVAEVIGNEVKVTVGSVIHPMLEEHHIAFVYVETENGGIRVNLKDEPVAEVYVGNTKPVAVYEYCNLHGLWKVEL